MLKLKFQVWLKFVYWSIFPHMYKLYKKKPIFVGSTKQVILISCQLWLLLTYMFFLIRRKWHGLPPFCKSQFVLVIFTCYTTSIIDLSLLFDILNLKRTWITKGLKIVSPTSYIVKSDSYYLACCTKINLQNNIKSFSNQSL